MIDLRQPWSNWYYTRFARKLAKTMTNQNTSASSVPSDGQIGLQMMSGTEKKAASGLVLIYVSRMLGLFMVLPVLSAYGMALEGATPALLGFALGVYGLMQALLQIPFGMASDRFGRKPLITIGLLIFVLGSVLAAYADTIEMLVAGRALQGAGAVAAAVLALAADLTREEQRTKIMAILGVSIGMAFVLSLVLGPLVASWWGMSGVFLLTAALGLVAILSLYFIVPTPEKLGRHRDAQSHLDQLGEVVKDAGLLRLDVGIFLLHAMMTACFVVLPLTLIDAGVGADDQWTVYLPAVAIALLILVPMMGLADGKGLGKEVFLISIAALAVVQTLFGFAEGSKQLMIAIGLFFGFFSVLEAMLPSLVSKMAPAGAKGTAMGVYSSAQFLGAFVGGSLGGFLYGEYGGAIVFWVAAAATLVWLLVAWAMKMPVRTAVMLMRSEVGADSAVMLREQPGVLDVYFDPEACVFHVKLNKDLADVDRLRALCLVG